MKIPCKCVILNPSCYQTDFDVFAMSYKEWMRKDDRETIEIPSMRNNAPVQEIEYYRAPNGKKPFTEWFESIRDKNTQQRIDKRLAKLEDGNFGDCQSVGGGVFELRLHFGPGYRIYFGQIGNTLILLLCGGDKKSQQGDIETAKTYWREYKESHL